MNSPKRIPSLEKKIRTYINGELEEDQIEELWKQLLKHPHYHGYLQIEYLLKRAVTSGTLLDFKDEDTGEEGINFSDWYSLAVILLAVLVF